MSASPAASRCSAVFSITEALDDLGRAYRDHTLQAGYRAQWAQSNPRTEITTLGWAESASEEHGYDDE